MDMELQTRHDSVTLFHITSEITFNEASGDKLDNNPQAVWKRKL